jgi:broad specificity phosphatase PhoE
LAAGEIDIDWPGGETAAALRRRVEAAWHALAERGEPIVVVSHAGPIRIALAVADGVDPRSVDLPAAGAILRWRPPGPA